MDQQPYNYVDSDPNDDLSVGSDPAPNNEGLNAARKRRKWTFKLRPKNKNKDDSGKPNTSYSISCGCKSAIKASCLISVSALIELIGNLICLIFGISFIIDACNFYELDSAPETRSKEYEEKLEDVVFLQRNRVGFTGLLAISFIGLVVGLLMPIGTLMKSFKSLSASLSLLFAMVICHMVLICVYLYESQLIATVAVIPFRVYEIFLIGAYLKSSKKRRQECLGSADNCDPPANSSFIILGSAGQGGMDQSIPVAVQQQQQPGMSAMSAVQVTFDLGDGNNPEVARQASDMGQLNQAANPPKISKRQRLLNAWKTERKPRQRYIDAEEMK